MLHNVQHAESPSLPWPFYQACFFYVSSPRRVLQEVDKELSDSNTRTSWTLSDDTSVRSPLASTLSWTNPPAFPGVRFLGKTSNKVPRTILLVSFVNAISPEGLERIRKHILCAYAHTRAHTGALRSLLMMSCVWLRLFTTTGDHLINQYCRPAGQCFHVLAFGDGQ